MDPISLIKSRANMQAISESPSNYAKYAVFDTILKDISADMKLWMPHPEKKHTFVLNTVPIDQELYPEIAVKGVLTPAALTDLIAVIKDAYPGCDVSYLATSPKPKVILREITIDWS